MYNENQNFYKSLQNNNNCELLYTYKAMIVRLVVFFCKKK